MTSIRTITALIFLSSFLLASDARSDTEEGPRTGFFRSAITPRELPGPSYFETPIDFLDARDDPNTDDT